MVMQHHLALVLVLVLALVLHLDMDLDPGQGSRDGRVGMEDSVQGQEQGEWTVTQAEWHYSGLLRREYNRTNRIKDRQVVTSQQWRDQTVTTPALVMLVVVVVGSTTDCPDRWAAPRTATGNSLRKKKRKRTWRQRSKRSAS